MAVNSGRRRNIKGKRPSRKGKRWEKREQGRTITMTNGSGEILLQSSSLGRVVMRVQVCNKCIIDY